jgi:two-component system sensor histidine kinase/response regulator
VAEDNAVNQRLAGRLLEKRGYHYVVAGTGVEALAALEREPFDLVLMDVQMPEMDGYETTVAIRARERDSGAHVQVVAMTAHAMKGDRERCLAAGMDDYLSKPLHADELFAIIDHLFPSPIEAPAVAAAGGPVFDKAAALGRVGGDEAVLQELAHMFLEESARLMPQIRRAVAHEDSQQLRRAAHTFKGVVSIFTATAAADAAQKLESMGEDGNLAEAAAACRALEEAIERLEPELAALARRPVTKSAD